MVLQAAKPRQTCSYCCKPFTEQDPGTLVEGHKYLGDITAPASDPNTPTCVLVQLGPERILCRECCQMFGYEDFEDNGGSNPLMSPEIDEKDPGIQSGPSQAIAGARSANTRPQLDKWAFAVEHGGVWHVFKRFGEEWRHQGRATGIASGRQEELLLRFAEGGGHLGDDAAVKLMRPTYSKGDRVRIMKSIKPEISRLRKVIRDNLNVTGKSVNPLPRDRHSRGWQAAIAIGYAVKNDDFRLEFKLREQLSTEELLDG